MALITREQREREIQERVAFKQGQIIKHDKLSDELRQSLSVADRLMRRADLAKFKTIFTDDLGDFVIETRQLTSSERLQAVTLNNMLAESDKIPEKYMEAIDGFKKLAKEITLTPGMDTYYDSDQVSDDVLIAVVYRTFTGTMQFVGEAITSFRAK